MTDKAIERLRSNVVTKRQFGSAHQLVQTLAVNLISRGCTPRHASRSEIALSKTRKQSAVVSHVHGKTN